MTHPVEGAFFMAINYPVSLDSLTTTSGSDRMIDVDHAGIHNDANEAIEALQSKVGINSSANTNSLDYKVTSASSSNPGHKHTLAQGATDVTASVAEVNILDGVTSSTAELNILDGVTSSAAELNILDGATLSTTELNYVDGVTSAIQTQINALPSSTGWTSSSDTWTYASATTFTIAGVDRTAIFKKGTKIWFTQTTSKYFYVATDATFSTNTTVTVTAGDDYSIANAAITTPYYSYVSNPQGFPKVFNYTPTLTGFSADPTNTVNRFFLDGTVCTVAINHGSNGTSNATGFTATLPITAKTLTNASWAAALSRAVDNGTTYYGEGNVYVLSAGTVMNISAPNGNWTNSGAKACTLYFSYEI